MVDSENVPKPPRKRRAGGTPKKPARGKAMATAIVALLLAAADLFLTIRMGIKVF